MKHHIILIEGMAAALMESVAYMQSVRAELISTVAIQYYTLLSLEAQETIYEQTENQICSLTGKPSSSIIPRGSLGSWKAPESIREGGQLRRAGKQS